MTQPATIPATVPTNGAVAAPPSQVATPADAPEPLVFAVFSLSGTWQFGQLVPVAPGATPDPFRIIRMVVRENGDIDVYAKSEGDNDYTKQNTSVIVTLYARTVERVITLARNDVWVELLREEDEEEEDDEPEGTSTGTGATT